MTYQATRIKQKLMSREATKMYHLSPSGLSGLSGLIDTGGFASGSIFLLSR
jgi:hypothetical protein